RWQDVVVDFVVDDLMGSGLWDGVFYDNMWDGITYFAGNNIDTNQDGLRDTNPDEYWRQGMSDIYRQTRARMPDGGIILGNGQTTMYRELLDGIMLENFHHS